MAPFEIESINLPRQARDEHIWGKLKNGGLFFASQGVDAQLPVGGPASQQLGWVKELKEHAEKTGVALDFISTHQ